MTKILAHQVQIEPWWSKSDRCPRRFNPENGATAATGPRRWAELEKSNAPSSKPSPARSADSHVCCIADCQSARGARMPARLPTQVGNLRNSRLGSLRYVNAGTDQSVRDVRGDFVEYSTSLNLIGGPAKAVASKLACRRGSGTRIARSRGQMPLEPVPNARR